MTPTLSKLTYSQNILKASKEPEGNGNGCKEDGGWEKSRGSDLF